jgi:RNA polymerase sigma-70 factor (ECF subfamily)
MADGNSFFPCGAQVALLSHRFGMFSNTDVPQFEEWLAQARAGNREALGRLLEQFRAFLLAEAERRTKGQGQSRVSSSDLVQMTYVEAVRQIGTFQGRSPGELAAWLRTILVHNASDQFRKSQTQARDSRREEPLALDPGGGHDPASSSSLPPVKAIRREEYAQLDEAIRGLGPDDQFVLLARYRDQWTFAQIGQHLGMTENAARKLWVRAMARLREELKKRRA